MDLGLQQKNVLVAAASQGLGKAIAERFVQEGANVYICARDTERLAETAQAIGAKGITCDLMKPADIKQMIKTIGQIDVLVTNAGGPKPGTFRDISDEDWQHTFELTYLSAVRLIRAALPNMQKNKWGRIICLASSSVKQPIENLIASNAIRAAVTNMAKSLANEVGKDGVTVNVVAPGMFETDRMQQLLQARAEKSGYMLLEEKDMMQRTIPAGRFGDVSELAATVAFLASVPAAYINGCLLPVDGGLTKVI